MSAQQGVNLTTILRRLEVVTSRLEDVAGVSPAAPPTSASRAVGGGGAVTTSAPASAAAPQNTAFSLSSENLRPVAQAYQDDIIEHALSEVLSSAKQIGGIVEQHTALLETVCSTQLAFIQMAATHSKPSDVGPLLKPQADAIQAVMEAKEKLGKGKDGREWGTCLSVVADGVPAWGWVQLEKAPTAYVEEMKNASQFWVNRSDKQFKESKPEVLVWTKAFIALVEALRMYVKQWHLTGMTWDPKGQPAPPSMPSGTESAAAAPPPPPPAPGGPPPPPPPPPADYASAPAPGAAPAATGQAALLADLNRGGSVTSGLKKVDPSQMTHKNPALRESSAVPEKKTPPVVKAKPGALTPGMSQSAAKKPARTELQDGNKWIVEYHEDNKSIIIKETELSHTVHIFNCNNSVIQIGGKINAVAMVGCRKTSLVIDSAIASLSITSSPSFEVQVTGSVPTIQIDTTDSGSIYLSEMCMETVEIITAKTSSLNICVPTGDDGDFEERPVPEQMKSKIVKGKLVTEIVEHAG